MNAPNRQSQVADIIAPFLPFPTGDAHDPARLKVLLENIIPGLNRLDGGRWGCLMKTDQGNKIPCDVLVWKDTNEVIDCLTRDGATWNNMGPNVDNPAWKWTAVANTEPAPPIVPDPVEPGTEPVITRSEFVDVVNELHRAIVAEVNQHLDDQVRQLNASLKPVVEKILGAA